MAETSLPESQSLKRSKLLDVGNKSSQPNSGQPLLKKMRESGTKTYDIVGKMPHDLNIIHYAESRATEIASLSAAVAQFPSKRLPQQKLPRHMQRRAMGHNVKRFPRRLRESIKRMEMYKFQEGLPKSKRPSRKHRRKPKNLLEAYNRRKRNHVWLETHIWHAKRFHMVNKWGYRLPLQPTERAVRASYRACKKHCLLQDVSFLSCLQISGPEEDILVGLSRITNPDAGITFADKKYLSGAREGQIFLYDVDKYPTSAVGHVSFIWKPNISLESEGTSCSRDLWIWCHPACHNQIWQLITRSFHPTKVHSNPDDSASDAISQKNTLLKEVSDEDQFRMTVGDVKFQSLKDRLVRYRLMGPLSLCVLADAIHIADILPSEEANGKWWQTYFEDQSASICCTQQREYWEFFKKSSSPAQLFPHMVIGLTVGDPRLTRPTKKMKVMPALKENGSDLLLCEDAPTPEIAHSPLWHQKVREDVAQTKMSDQKLNDLRSEQFIPGICLELGSEESRIPVILIQNPGLEQASGESCTDSCSGLGHGWDIILPQEWGMAFWISFVYRGARVGGLKATDMIRLEQRKLQFPSDSPDTMSGTREEDEVFKEMREKFFRHPPAKRLNFIKLGIKCPFHCPWKILVDDWIKERETFERNEICEDGVKLVNSEMKETKNESVYVLRSKSFLELINKFCLQKSIANSMKEDDTDHMAAGKELMELVSANLTALVPVRITLLSRGTAEMFSHICIPSLEDVKKLSDDKIFAGPIEAPHIDKTKLSKKEKKILTKKQRKAKCNEKDLYKQNVTDIVKHCSRWTIGFVKHGGFSMRSGGGVGLGFCSVVGLAHLLQNVAKLDWCLVLVRSTESNQYRFASLEVVT